MEQEEKLSKLQNRENHLESRIISLTKRRQWFLYGGLCVLFITLIIYLSDEKIISYHFSIPISTSIVLIVSYLGLSSRIRLKEKELREIYLDIDIERLDTELKSLNIDKDIIYAEKTLRLHNDQLKKYYDLNLNQNSLIFRFGIFCILLGFCIIIISCVLVSRAEDSEKIIVGVLGGIGAILSNYIAALYLKMNSSVSDSLKEFHSKLTETHKLLTGNLLISKIKNQDLRETSYSEIAKSINSRESRNGN